MDLLYGVCLKYLKEPESAKDAVMQLFEELTKKLRQHQVENVKSWLHTLAKNHCLMQLRSPRNFRTSRIQCRDYAIGFRNASEWHDAERRT